MTAQCSARESAAAELAVGSFPISHDYHQPLPLLAENSFSFIRSTSFIRVGDGGAQSMHDSFMAPSSHFSPSRANYEKANLLFDLQMTVHCKSFPLKLPY